MKRSPQIQTFFEELNFKMLKEQAEIHYFLN